MLIYKKYNNFGIKKKEIERFTIERLNLRILSTKF